MIDKKITVTFADEDIQREHTSRWRLTTPHSTSFWKERQTILRRILSVEFKYQDERYQNPTCRIMVLQLNEQEIRDDKEEDPESGG